MSEEEDNVIDDSKEENENEEEEVVEDNQNQQKEEKEEEEQQQNKDEKKNEENSNQQKENSQPSNQQQKENKNQENKKKQTKNNNSTKSKIKPLPNKTKIKPKTKPQSINYFPNVKKSKNSQLVESLYSQLLNSNNIDIYSNLLKNDDFEQTFFSKNNIKPKQNQEKAFQNLIERQKAFEDSKNNYIKSQQEKMDVEFKNKCTWQPETNNKDQPKRKLNEFLDSQKEFLQNKKEFIDKMEKNLKEKEKEQTNVKLCSKTSEEIVKKKNNSEKETYEKFNKRLII